MARELALRHAMERMSEMDKCANVDCQSLERIYEREGVKFCSATCADSYEAKNLADAMVAPVEHEDG
jgi:hypothetical protein